MPIDPPILPTVVPIRPRTRKTGHGAQSRASRLRRGQYAGLKRHLTTALAQYERLEQNAPKFWSTSIEGRYATAIRSDLESALDAITGALRNFTSSTPPNLNK